MKRLLYMFTIALVSAVLSVNSSPGGVFCNPAVDTDCVPLVEHLWLKEGDKAEKALPVVIGYVHDPAERITLRTSPYPTLGDLENDLDTQVINLLSEYSKDDEFLSFLRETGEEFTVIPVSYKVTIKKSDNPKVPAGTKITYLYKGIILPSGSIIVLRRVVWGEYSAPTLTASQLLDSQVEQMESEHSPVILKTGADFWKDYLAYYKDRKSRGLAVKSPSEFFREDWKKLPRRVRTVELPPVYLIKNGKLLVMRGKTVYGAGELSDSYLKRIKTLEGWNWYLKDEKGNVIDSFEYPAGTDLLTIFNAYREEDAKTDKNKDKLFFLSRAVAKTLLMFDSKATKFFNFDLGYAYLMEEDGVHNYAVIYAGTPKVLEYKAKSDPHYTQYGMDDPTKIYWNEPLRNSVVVPERIACLYYAGKNCKRFKVYKPASSHPAKDETLRFYYWKWKKKVGLSRIVPDSQRRKVVSAINKALWSETVDTSILSGVSAEYVEALRETVEKPLVISSRSYAEENYVLTCNENTEKPEALFVVPTAFKEEAQKTGLILKEDERGRVGVYFDQRTRIPIPKISCEKLQEQVDRPVFKLKTSLPPPDKLIKEMENYVERKRRESSTGSSGGETVYSPAVGGGLSIGGGGSGG